MTLVNQIPKVERKPVIGSQGDREKVELIVKMYDAIILNCQNERSEKAIQALVELIAALDFSYEEISTRLYRLYEYCMNLVKFEKYQEAIKIIQGLRDAWMGTLTNFEENSQRNVA